MNRALPAPFSDIALLVARVLLGVVMFAHGYQKMVINGISRTTEGFESLSIPLAIMSASFVTVVEFAGSALLIVGVATPFVSVCNMIIMAGAAFFVHAKNGIFVANGGWELVGVIGAGFLLLAAAGPGRFSIDHIINRKQSERREAIARSLSTVTKTTAKTSPTSWPRPASPTGPSGAHDADALWTPPAGVAPLPRRAPRPETTSTDLPASR